MNDMPLDQQRILLTGAAKRVGRSIALAAARAGADIVLHYANSQAEAESAAAEIRALGRHCDLLRGDLNDAAAVQRIFEQAAAGGAVTALVNNASIFEALDWQSTTLEDWNRHMMINLTAPFLLSQAFAQNLADGTHGRILNLLDWRALRPGRDYLPYTISKSALAALTRSLAIALAPRITVNGLALGAILPASDGSDDALVLRNTPAARWAEMNELDQAALFLLGGPAYITGEILHLDGGRHAV